MRAVYIGSLYIKFLLISISYIKHTIYLSFKTVLIDYWFASH